MNEDFFLYGFKYFLITSITSLITAIIINFLLKRIIKKINKHYQDKVTTNQYIYKTLSFIIWLICLTVIMKQIKPLNSIGNAALGATSILAIAIGIAAQTTFGNYIAGFFLAIHQPFKVGDIIRIKEKSLSGTVKEITFRHTILLTQEQTEIIIPNTIMNTAIIEDMSNGNYSELIYLKLKTNTNLDKVQNIIDEIIDDEELIIKKDEKELIIKNITSEGYEIAFAIHTNSLSDFIIVRNKILPLIIKKFKSHKIEMF